MRATTANKAPSGFIYLIVIFCALLFIFPVYLSLINSLNSWNAIPGLIPRGFNWENYKFATTMIDFWLYTKNSIILCAIVVFTATFTSGLVGYAFARIQVPGRNFLFLLVLSTLMVPGIITQIPTYILFHKLHLLNSFLPWLIWGIGGGVGNGSAYFVFFYRQFFSTIPKELEEAARIDGCSIFRTYWSIFLPLSLPVVATVAIITFQWNWSDNFTPFLFMSQEHYNLATALGSIGYFVADTKLIIQPVSVAAGLMFILPVLLTFFIGQRFIVEGIVTTGIKG
ncbi:carbohydrate ABC transporter permease [Paenibacillus psychroresistens]|uniref:Carbohydrate ABC transporter permease n=1 Tax=Paenibacillus psychroresistens TaxID=1778678 RepID=A0A6B8RP72_9BACL|nr:carbohydrate ABC transporter permease [Paenibacillus psychroresistens]QGQ98161.1 carbohydrate ABC transporter permease [Paenibacillus psychroresistens]